MARSIGSRVVPGQRDGDDPTPKDRAEIGSLLNRHRDRLFNIVLHIVGTGGAESGPVEIGAVQSGVTASGDTGSDAAESGGIAPPDVASHRVAAEVTRNAFFQVIASSEQWRGAAPPLDYILRAVVRAALIHRRSGVAGQSSGERGPSVPRADQGTALRAQCEDASDAAIENLPCRDALLRIDESLCALLVLRDVDAMAYRQIADVMEMTIRNVKRGLIRARLSLRRQILAAAEPPPGAADS